MDRQALRRQCNDYRERAVECVGEALAAEPGSFAQQLACRDGLFWADRAEAISLLLGEAQPIKSLRCRLGQLMRGVDTRSA